MRAKLLQDIAVPEMELADARVEELEVEAFWTLLSMCLSNTAEPPVHIAVSTAKQQLQTSGPEGIKGNPLYHQWDTAERRRKSKLVAQNVSGGHILIGLGDGHFDAGRFVMQTLKKLKRAFQQAID